MIFNLSNSPDKKVQEFYDRAMKELGKFYEINWNKNKPIIFLIDNREDIDSLKGYKTEEWVVGFTAGSEKFLFLLNPKSYETESNHKYSDKEFFRLIKHELSHLYAHILYKGFKPVWLLEGIAIYSSGQLEVKKKPEKFKKFLDYYDKGDSGVYAESGFAVEILVENYGKEKFLQFYKDLKKVKNQKDLSRLFEEHYKEELTYDFFNKYLEQ